MIHYLSTGPWTSTHVLFVSDTDVRPLVSIWIEFKKRPTVVGVCLPHVYIYIFTHTVYTRTHMRAHTHTHPGLGRSVELGSVLDTPYLLCSESEFIKVFI